MTPGEIPDRRLRNTEVSAGSSSPDRLILVLEALKRVLGPVVRLALWAGAKHQQVDGLLRLVFVEEARKQLLASGLKANTSQIAVLTGIHRKDLRERVLHAPDHLPDTQSSQTSRVVARWLLLSQDNPAFARLPLQTASEPWSVERIVRMETGGDTHYRATLGEMARLGLVRVEDGHAEIIVNQMGASRDLADNLSFLADNTRDHLAAATHNVMGLEPRFLERSLFVGNVTPEAVAHIQGRVKGHWSELYGQAYSDMLLAEQPNNPAATQRIRFGMYFYAQPMDAPSREANGLIDPTSHAT
jgi:hypothetical protein